MEKYSPLVVFLLSLAFSLQIHARESQFFAKTLRVEASPKLSSSIAAETVTALPPLPPQSHVGYGLYGRDADRFPSTNNHNYNYDANTNNVEFSTVDFSEGYDNNNERSNGNNIPSSFDNAEFPTESYDNHYKERSNANNPDGKFTTETNVNSEEFSDAKSVPTTFSDEEFNRYESSRVPNYANYDKQYGMSDTRVLENGKYFYDVNAERNSRGAYEPIKESSERYGSYDNRNVAYKNEEGQQIPEEFDP